MNIKMIDLDNKATSSITPPPTTPIIDPKIHKSAKSGLIIVISFATVAIIGFYFGVFLKSSIASRNSVSKSSLAGIQAEIPESGVKVGDIFGSADEKAFNTTATGVLDKGGLNGEGTHKLVRPGGISQTVYLTSSVIDLDQLVGNQVTIWGETFKGQKAGWLMDVGRARVENLNAPLPK